MSEKVSFPKWALQALPNYNSKQFVAFFNAYNKSKLELYKEKDATYGGSWQKDGFVGAFLNLKRKIDRLLNMWANGNLLDFEQSGESILDTFMDMENYSTLCLGFIIFSIKSKQQYDFVVGKNPLFKQWIGWHEGCENHPAGVYIVGGVDFGSQSGEGEKLSETEVKEMLNKMQPTHEQTPSHRYICFVCKKPVPYGVANDCENPNCMNIPMVDMK